MLGRGMAGVRVGVARALLASLAQAVFWVSPFFARRRGGSEGGLEVASALHAAGELTPTQTRIPGALKVIS